MTIDTDVEFFNIFDMDDFAKYLLNYTERFFTKKTDLVSIILALVAAIVTISGLIDSLSFHNPNQLPYSLLTSIPLGALIGVIIKMGKTNYNSVVFDIDQSIFQHYTNINGTDEQERLDIIKKLQELLSKKPSPTEVEEFKKILSSRRQ